MGISNVSSVPGQGGDWTRFQIQVSRSAGLQSSCSFHTILIDFNLFTLTCPLWMGKRECQGERKSDSNGSKLEQTRWPLGNSSQDNKSRIQTRLLGIAEQGRLWRNMADKVWAAHVPTRVSKGEVSWKRDTQHKVRRNSDAKTADCPWDQMLLFSSRFGHTNPQ